MAFLGKSADLQGLAAISSDDHVFQRALGLDDSQVGHVLEASYIFVGVCFMYAISGLGHPEKARMGNASGIVGMFIAILFVFLDPQFQDQFLRCAVCMVPAFIVGLYIANKAEMISMPQMVAGFHAMVGLAALLVAYARYYSDVEMNAGHLAETIVGIFFGGLTFTGSIVACCKLQGTISFFGKCTWKVSSTPLVLPKRHELNGLIVLACFVLGYLFCTAPRHGGEVYLHTITGLCLFLGWHLVMSIGGADMPVVVSMLNSYSGWTTVAAGFMLDNNLLIIAGSIIGSSGAILSYIMCRGMNRSFVSVIAGGFGVEEGTQVQVTGTHTETNVSEVVQMMMDAKSIVIVPGYGMAVARCQGTVGSLAAELRKLGKKVRFGIHEVAGRLPGHMNVLLAEANVPYDIVCERSHLANDMPSTDLSIVIGANDIVNPLAAEDPNSPIAGMPVIEVWKAKKCVVMKRGLATGYAGVDNPLFYKENARMLFGSADKVANQLFAELQKRASAMNSEREAKYVNDKNTALLSAAASVLPKPKKEYPPAVKTVGIVKEAVPNGETRVAMAPSMVPKFREMGFHIVMERGAGEAASFPDSLYMEEGVDIVASAATVYKQADIIMMVSDLKVEDVSKLRSGQIVVAYVWPAQKQKEPLVDALARQGVTALSMDAVPRTTIAQKMDSLSSMANMAGYKAVIDAFFRLPRYSKPLTTAAGSVPPAKVFVAGAGVAGLSAIGTARSLGAVVRANDTRSVVKEQVESMGAEFLEVDFKEEGAGAGGYAKDMSAEFKEAQAKMVAQVVADSDVVITTANIPGRPAPRLITSEMVRNMRPGSVCVDLAAVNGGNIELTKKDEVYVDKASGVTLVGLSNLAATMPAQASELYSANLGHLFNHIGGAAKVDGMLAEPDATIKACMVTKGGQVVYKPPTAPPPAPTKPAVKKEEPKKAAKEEQPQGSGWASFFMSMFGFFALCMYLGVETDNAQIEHFLAMVMAVVVGYFLVWNVDPALHTPLMSVTNAVSGIIVTGTLLQLHGDIGSVSVMCALLGTFCASVNIFGGFLLTKKMLDFFKK